MVEPRGFEPLTFSLRSSGSSNPTRTKNPIQWGFNRVILYRDRFKTTVQLWTADDSAVFPNVWLQPPVNGLFSNFKAFRKLRPRLSSSPTIQQELVRLLLLVKTVNQLDYLFEFFLLFLELSNLLIPKKTFQLYL